MQQIMKGLVFLDNIINL